MKETGDIDLVASFERRHIAEIARRFPNLRRKAILLSQLAADSEGPPDIAVPHGAESDTFLACFRRIENLVDHIAAAQRHTSRPDHETSIHG